MFEGKSCSYFRAFTTCGANVCIGAASLAVARGGPWALPRLRASVMPALIRSRSRSRGRSEHGVFFCEKCCILAHMQRWGCSGKVITIYGILASHERRRPVWLVSSSTMYRRAQQSSWM